MLVIRFAFDTVGARRMELRTDLHNIRSRRLAERLGFCLEGILRRVARSATGELTDQCVFALLDDEYRLPTWAQATEGRSDSAGQTDPEEVRTEVALGSPGVVPGK